MKAAREDHQSAMQGEVFVVILCVVLVVAVAGVRHLQFTAKGAQVSAASAPPVKVTPQSGVTFEPHSVVAPNIERPNYPPLIRLGDKQLEIVFDSKTGDLTPATEQMIRNRVVPKLEAYARKHNCDVVEVYGFTDGRSMAGERGTLGDFDASIFEFLRSSNHEKPPLPASNTELAMMRAASVARILFQEQLLGHLPSIRDVRILSGGPFTLPNGSPAVPSYIDELFRRRVDLRLSNRRQFEPAD